MMKTSLPSCPNFKHIPLVHTRTISLRLGGMLIFGLGLFNLCHARTLEKIRESGMIRIAADGATPPFNYFKGKELVGFEIDIASEIATRLGLKVEWTVQPFNTLLLGLQNDRFDLIATSHAVTPPRALVVDFADPHYCTSANIVSLPGGPKKVSELVGKWAAVPVGTVYFETLKRMDGVKIKTVPNETDGLQHLLSRRADAWITDRFVAQASIPAHRQTGIAIGEPIHFQTDAMAVSKGNSTLKEAVNSELKKIMEDGTYSRLSQTYFQEDIRCKSEKSRRH